MADPTPSQAFPALPARDLTDLRTRKVTYVGISESGFHTLTQGGHRYIRQLDSADAGGLVLSQGGTCYEEVVDLVPKLTRHAQQIVERGGNPPSIHPPLNPGFIAAQVRPPAPVTVVPSPTSTDDSGSSDDDECEHAAPPCAQPPRGASALTAPAQSPPSSPRPVETSGGSLVHDPPASAAGTGTTGASPIKKRRRRSLNSRSDSEDDRLVPSQPPRPGSSALNNSAGEPARKPNIVMPATKPSSVSVQPSSSRKRIRQVIAPPPEIATRSAAPHLVLEEELSPAAREAIQGTPRDTLKTWHLAQILKFAKDNPPSILRKTGGSKKAFFLADGRQVKELWRCRICGVSRTTDPGVTANLIHHRHDPSTPSVST